MAGGGAPCGACKFLRRKCAKGCVFAPYFASEELGASDYGAIHKVFGASNFSKLLLHLPLEERYDAVVSVSYEAQARLHDPIHGCVSHIFALQHQVAYLQAELTFAHAKLAGSSEEISLSPENIACNLRGTSSPSNNSPCGRYCPSNEPQSSHQSGSDNITTLYSYQKDSCLPTSMNCSDGMPLSPAQQMNCTIQDERESWEADVAQGGDLQALAFALLRRNRK